eukprot:2679200-Prymnesium_polylepis.1
MRAVVNQAVLRTVESGKKQVSASTVAAVLRPYAERMDFTSVVPPMGLIRHAQREGILSKSSEDKEMHKEEKEIAETTKLMAGKWQEAESARLEARRAKRVTA